MKNTAIKFLNLGIQLQIRSDNNIYQQRTKIDIEINELWVLMNEMPKRRYTKKKKKTSHKVQLTEEGYINNTSGRRQNVVRDPGEKSWQQLEDNAMRDT